MHILINIIRSEQERHQYDLQFQIGLFSVFPLLKLNNLDQLTLSMRLLPHPLRAQTVKYVHRWRGWMLLIILIIDSIIDRATKHQSWIEFLSGLRLKFDEHVMLYNQLGQERVQEERLGKWFPLPAVSRWLKKQSCDWQLKCKQQGTRIRKIIVLW